MIGGYSRVGSLRTSSRSQSKEMLLYGLEKRAQFHAHMLPP